jgi:predicted ATPase/signal transduction histidine kinase
MSAANRGSTLSHPSLADRAEALVSSILAGGDLELVHRNARHVFLRGKQEGRPVLVKKTADPPEPDAVVSLRHEHELLRERNFPGVVKVLGLARTGGGLALLMEDAGRCTLAERIASAPIGVTEALDTALQLAEAVSRLHEARIVHRNIHPNNIVWDPEARRATLVDFRIATSLSAISVESASPAHLEGALRYISPEQTGRTGRSVDSRADLYALGATFYDMLTGSPPFTAEDPIELVHAHLARRPRPPHELNRDVPIALSRLILKLLEKEPEQRYQTALALVQDLQEARTQWTATGTILPFALAQQDVSRDLSIPDKLYGRGTELRTLQEAFDRASRGRRELVLVTGAPGTGKSALVSHLERPVLESRGLLVAGKFDQLRRSEPFSGLTGAFRALVRRLLTEPEPVVAAWRERLAAAVAPNGQVLVDVMPELEGLLGPQPPVPQLEPVESRNRFHLAFTAFLRAFARPGQPFVLFLDDLQWVDAASLQLLEQWARDAESRHVLLIAAYRDTELGPGHPAAMSLAGVREGGTPVHEIHLGPLGHDDVAHLIADALSQDPVAVRPLADLVVAKTAGNPFFVRRLLHTFRAEGWLRFDPRARAWQWDMAQLERAPVSDNVLDLMARAIEGLPEATKALLQVAACIGHQFDLGTLAAVSGRSRTSATNDLWPALEDGLLVPLREAYRAPRVAGPMDGDLETLPGEMQFVHDRVQQAAYALLPEERRCALHLDIGRRLLAAANGQLDDRLFDIVDQLNLGAALMTAQTERRRLIELNLAAGRKARASAAYHAAFDYLSAAMRHLPDDPWSDERDLAVALHRDLAECAYLSGQHATAEKLIDTALQHTRSKLAQADLYSLRVLAATVAGDSLSALRWGREGLSVFGLAWPDEHLAETNEAEARAVMRTIASRRIQDLAEEPEVRDEETRACMRLVSLLGPPAYFVGADVLTSLVNRGATLALLHGPSVYSAYAYVFYGAVHNARTGEYDVGYAFGELALALARRFGHRGEESRTVEVFGLTIHPWKAPLRESLPLLREGFRAGVESGELAYAAFNLCSTLINGLPSGVPLAQLLADADLAIDFADRHQNRTAREICLPFRQLARALSGATASPRSFDDAQFDEARFVEAAHDNQTALGQFWVARLQLAYLFGDHDAAVRASGEAARRVSAGILGMVTSAEHLFYTALTLLAGHKARSTPPPELEALHGQLRAWARYCPSNFRHKQKLVEAELQRIAGQPWRAMKLYREAVAGAHEEAFIQDAALASELAGRFFLESGEPAIAHSYLRAALADYRKWGATAKVRALADAYPGAFVAGTQPGTEGGTGLDALGLIKASQAISAESVPSRLFERILRIVMEVAGAQRGSLLLGASEALVVRARAAVDEGTGFTVSLDETRLEDDPSVPHAIVRRVARLREPVVLAEATDSEFADDPQVRALRIRSAACVPLMRQAAVVGVLYLENNAMAGAFTSDRIEVVQVLAAQAAISLENSTFLLERERSARTSQFLASASAALVESLDAAASLARVVQLAVPFFADWCLLDLADEHGALHRAQVAHADAGQAELAGQLAPLTLDGQGLHLERVSPGQLEALSRDEQQLELLRAIQPRSVIAAPVVARGRTLGVLTFIAAQSGRCFDTADRDAAQELAKRCALAMDNARLYKDAQDAVRARDEFLAIASHELKTPLTSLQLQLATVERRLPGLIPDGEGATWLKQRLDVLNRQGERLERLVHELLDISRIAGGRLRLELEPVDISEVVRQVASRFEESGETARRHCTMTVDGCASSIVGRWDRLRLDQVVTNLLSNALKYGDGKPIEVALASEGGVATLSVTDRGIGIAPEHLQRIFGRFERAVSSRHYGGLGLGLFIATQIVETMGGAIGVRSTVGEGSTFTVTLPLASADS